MAFQLAFSTSKGLGAKETRMQRDITHKTQLDRRDSLKRLSVGMLGLSSLVGVSPSWAGAGFSAQGLKRIAPAMKWQMD